jgi:hypothetical protein
MRGKNFTPPENICTFSRKMITAWYAKLAIIGKKSRVI